MNTLKKEAIGFTQISNALLNDENISLKAKGLYAYLYSKPDGWNFEAGRIAKESKDGIDSVYSGLNELEKNGYLKRNRLSSGKVEYNLLSQARKKPNRENPSRGKSPSGKMGSISNKENIVINSNSNKDIILHSETSSQVNDLLKLFYTINPTINFGNKTYRKYLDEMIVKFGYDKLKGTIEYAMSISNDKYAPSITNPVELKNKMGNLINYYNKQKEDRPFDI